jgi:hypothetical protein
MNRIASWNVALDPANDRQARLSHGS